MFAHIPLLWELTKPRLTGLVVVTTWLGFELAVKRNPNAPPIWPALFGTWFVAASSAVFNQILEKDIDSKMHRTQKRPLPSGRIGVPTAVVWGVVLLIIGLALLWARVNAAATWLALASFIIYLAIYTPLKRTTTLCTLVGAIPGALPPVIGWVAGRGLLTPEAGILFGILFVWQLPHFLAIAILYQDDYARAQLPMLPLADPDGVVTARMILLNSLVLVPLSLLPSIYGLAGPSYFWGALGLGIVLFVFSCLAAFNPQRTNSRRLLLASVLYLPALMAWMVLA